MNRRRTLLATAGMLIVPGVTFAFFNRPYYPPARWVVYPASAYIVPFDPCVCPAPLPASDCPPPTNPPPRPLNPPKVMEKSEAPAPKVVNPTAATEPMPEKPKVEKAELPKGDLAIPSPAVPETPVDKPRPTPPAPAPLTVPPIDVAPAKPKKDEPPKELIPKFDPLPPKLELAAPKPDSPTLILPASGGEQPKKVDVPAIPLTIPKVSESNYTPAGDEPKVRVIAVEGRRSAGNQTVSVYNYTDRELEVQIDGKATKLPAKSLVSRQLPDSFVWKLGAKAETATIPSDAAGLSIVIQ